MANRENEADIFVAIFFAVATALAVAWAASRHDQKIVDWTHQLDARITALEKSK